MSAYQSIGWAAGWHHRPRKLDEISSDANKKLPACESCEESCPLEHTHWLREIAFTAHRESSFIRVWSNRRWWLFYQSNADDDDEEEVSLKDFECKTWKSRDAQCLWRRKFSFLFRDLFYFFSGWKFSSSSLLKILLGFRLKLLFFLCNGNCLSTECLGCFRVAFRVGKWQYFRSRVLKIADSHGMKEMINSHQPNKHKSRWWTDLQEIKFTFH